MKKAAGILTLNKNLVDEVRKNVRDIIVNHYPNVDSLRSDESAVLIIDFDFFDSDDNIQFYLSRIRKKIQKIPVILIIQAEFAAKINTNWFYNDFILYPFRDHEMEKRIANLMFEKEQDDDTVTIGHLNINFKEYLVYLNDEKLDLTYKEFEIMRLLIQNRGTVFSRKDILNKIWGIEYIGGTRTVDVHVRRLRSKLGDEFNSIIETVRNVGYKCK